MRNQTSAAKKIEPTFAERIEQMRAECEAYIDCKAAELKATPDGAKLPILVLRMTLTGQDSCSCRVAKRLLENEQ